MRWGLAVVVALGCRLATAQPRYRINHYEQLNNVVTQVNRIARDGQGMMWFATNDGLYRYDGYEFRNFKSHSGDGVNMPSNNISFMYANSEGGMWCIASKRVFLFDTKTYRFVDVLKDFEQCQGTSLRVKKLRTLPCGVTWLFTDDGRVLAVEDARPTESVKLMADYDADGDVTAVCDKKQRSWVLTSDCTLLYDAPTPQSFGQHCPPVRGGLSGGLRGDRGAMVAMAGCYRRILAADPIVWLLDDEGHLHYYDEQSRQIRPSGMLEHLLTKTGAPVTFDGMTLLTDGRIVLTKPGGGALLMARDGRSATVMAFKGQVRKVMEDGNGHLWIHGGDGRLSMSDMTGRVVQPVDGFQGEKCDLMRDKHGNVWFFSERGDAFYSDANRPGRLVRYEGDRMKGSISNTINDGQGGYWFIHNQHVCRLAFESPHYRRLPLEHSDQVRCVVADCDGRLLVGMRHSEAVAVFAPSGQRLGWLGSDGRISTGFTRFGAAIYSGYLAADGTLWLGSKEHGLFRLRRRLDGGFQVNRYYKDDGNRATTIPDNEVYCITADRQGRLWIGTHKGGLCCIADMKADEPRFLSADSGLEGARPLVGSSVRSLVLTPDDQLLVGSFGGLYIADIRRRDLRTLSFSNHQREADRAESLSSNSVTDVVLTSQGRYFVATGDGGINELLTTDLGADRWSFRHYNLTTGFPADNALSFIEYGGSLWIAMPGKLVELGLGDASQPVVNTFLTADAPHFSLCRPALLGTKGMVLGTDDGAVLVGFDELKQHSHVPLLVVTGVSKENSPVDYAAAHGDTIRLTAQERDLTIWFSALSYENTQQVAYAYRLTTDDGWHKSADKPWTYIGQSHSVSFSQMKPATYRMAIRSTDSNGAWCQNDRVLTIVVTPTFWETPWAVVLVLLIVAVVAAVVAYTLLYIRRISRQQRETMEKYLALLSEQQLSEGLRGGSVVEQQPEVSTTTVPAAAAVSEEDERLMERIMLFIEQHLADSDVTIDDMASAVAVSRSGLHRKVKSLVGTSPMDFLREARIRKASQMLRTTSKPVTQVAYECGFSDPKYFSKCFKASTGKTPTEYKNA